MKPIAFILLFLIFWGCRDTSDMPLPTEIKMNAEEGENADKRKQWLELVHGGPQSGWRLQEMRNQEERLAYLRSLPPADRDGSENLAGGRIKGKWIERGSNNQAGSIMNVWYDASNDALWAIGAGGPMFKGGLSGFSWALVNDDLRFDDAVLDGFPTENNAKRIATFSGGSPYYSEDDGLSWIKGSGVAAPADGYHIHSSARLKQSLWVLAKKGWSNNYILYRTEDGKKYTNVKVFTTSDGRNLAMCSSSDTEDLYLIEQSAADLTRVYKTNAVSTGIDLINSASPIGFGENGRGNIQCYQSNADTLLYVYDDENKLHKSNDRGVTWELLSTLPSTPWSVGLFVAPSNPGRLMYGEVNAYRSNNGGKNWLIVNEWWEYYGQVQTKLHADIMVMKEFKDGNNKDVIVIGHHGGISISYDYGVTTRNISLFGLNVSQYYDVRSLPADPNWIFAGSQDQGLQRGFVTEDNIGEFYQNISGDYGHIEFTGNGRHMWTMYPGGSLSFYLNPVNQNSPTDGYEINSQRESVWIPPIAVDPHTDEDIVYVAGGSVNENSNGSHIIKVTYKNGIKAEDLPFNFAVSGGEISAIAISPFDSDIWFVATTNGYIYKSTDGGQQFTLKQKMTSQAHYLYGACILPSSKDPNVIYLSGSGYNGIAPVYVSRSGGESFQAMRDGMPGTVAFQLAATQNEDVLFAATEIGPYVYFAADNKWFPLSGQSTPNQTFWSVEFIPALNTARFGTYGRGAWDFVMESLPLSISDSKESPAFNVWPNPVVSHMQWKHQAALRRMTLYNTNGIPVMEFDIKSENADLGPLPAGQYLLRIVSENKIIDKKIIKI